MIFVPVQSRSQSMPVRGLCSGMTLGKSKSLIDWLRVINAADTINACFLRELRVDILYAKRELSMFIRFGIRNRTI